MKKTIIFIYILLFSCIINADTFCPDNILCSTNNIASCKLYYPWEKIVHKGKQIYANYHIQAIVKNQGETASCYYKGNLHPDQSITLYDITDTLEVDLTVPYHDQWLRYGTVGYYCAPYKGTLMFSLCPFKFTTN